MTVGSSANIASWMEARAAERPHQRAVVFPASRDAAGRVAWTQLSFDQLNGLTDEYARGLVALGVERYDRVSLLVKPSLEFIPLVFAVFKVGALPVLIDPGMGRQQFLACLQRTKPRVLVGEPVVHALKTVFRRAFSSVEVAITVGGGTWFWGGHTLNGMRVASDEPFAAVHAEPGDEAAILFTSGSTGPAKGVTYTHGIFQAQTRAIGALYGFEPGEVDLACFPLFGLFSMALGMTVVIPDMDPTKPALADPAKLVEAIIDHGCTSGAGSPSIWRNLAPYCEQRGIRLPSLRRLMMFGAPIPVWMHESFRRILPEGAQIHTPYGATESLPVASIATDEILSDTRHATDTGAGTCVGHVAPDMVVRIIGVSDAPIERWSDDLVLPQGEIGEIVVRGPVVTREYKDEPQHTAAAKIIEVVDGVAHVCHRMGDVGYFDDRGRLWFCGRKSHRVTLADGRTMFTVPCEGVFNQHGDVHRTALVGVGGEPVLVVELAAGSRRPRSEIAAELRAFGRDVSATSCISKFMFHPSFPVDLRHNAKIHRPELAAWAAGQTAVEVP